MNSIIGPIPKQFEDYITSLPGALEVVPDVLYSTKTYTSASTTTLSFFDTGVSAGRYDVTNMTQGGSLPTPQSFLILNPRVFFNTTPQSDDSGAGAANVLTSAFSDVVKLTNTGIVTITINQKQYGPWPLWMWVANSFVKGAFSTGSDLLADYGQLDGNLYPFKPALCLLPLQPFTVTLNWPAGAVTLSQSTVDIKVLFDGQRARAIA